MEPVTEQQPAHVRGIDNVEELVGAVAAVVGAAAFVAGLVRHSRLLRVLGILLALAGGGVISRHRLAERSKKIDVAEGEIRSQLDDLDPVARAQVLADITREQL